MLPRELRFSVRPNGIEVFCNGELEGKIRMFRNGNFSYFGYTLQSVDEAEAKVVWNPPPSKKKKDVPAKGPVVWLRLEANGTDEVCSRAQQSISLHLSFILIY